MYRTVSPETLKALAAIDSPSMCNAIEGFDIRPRNSGFMGPEIKCVFPDFSPVVGYAVTATISSVHPEGRSVPREEWWDMISSVPEPRFIVIHDLDNPPLGALWGEVNGNIHRALKAVGVATDGTVRDLDEVRQLGFQFFAGSVAVSHAYVHLVEIGTPVTVGGLRVTNGDLLHGDKHGVTSIPFEIADQMADRVKEIADYEKIIIDACQSSDFTLEKLKKAANVRAPY